MKDKKKLITYLGAIGLFLLVIGISYAVFTANYVGDKEQQIVIGEDFIFSYNETSNALSLTNEDILSDTNGKASTKYFDFNVKLKTQYEKTINYYIYLTKDTSSTLDEQYIKLYLTNQSNTLVKGVTTINELMEHETYASSYYLYGTSITSNNNVEETHNYRLRVWVSDTYDTSYQTSEPGDGTHTSTTVQKTYKFTVNVATGEIPNQTQTLAQSEGNLISTWRQKTANEASYLALYTLGSATLPETYSYNGTTYTKSTSIDVSEQENDNVILGEYTSGSNMIALIGQDGKVMAPSDSSYLFSFLSNVTVLDLSNFDTSNVTSMEAMFNECGNLTSLDLTFFDTDNVTDMYGMFYNCGNLSSLNLTTLNTSSIADMTNMFYGCSSLTTLNLSNFNTANVTTMDAVFYGCTSLTSVDLSSFDTSKVTYTQEMFRNCSSLTSLDLSSFDTSALSSMSNMFDGCTNLTEITVGCDWVIGSDVTVLNMFDDAGTSEVNRVCTE